MEEIFTSFQYGIPAAIIVAVYLIVNKIIDVRKDRKKVSVNTDIISSFNKLNMFLEYITEDIIKKEHDKCEYAIKSSFNAFANSLLKFSVNTIVNNNIENNKDHILENVKHIVNTEFWNVYSCLILYKSGEEKVSDYLNQAWRDELYEDIVHIIFDSDKDKAQRIYNINNKIHIDIDSYCVHVLNRYATHKKVSI